MTKQPSPPRPKRPARQAVHPPDAGYQPQEPATPQMRLQILSTEHWSLLASRNLAWTESFTRAGMFLSTLSFSVVALALVAQASGFDEAFRLFALAVLPVVLFIGVGTQLRLDSANHHDGTCVIGMNRIRAAYMEIAPDLERYFVMGTTDDQRGVDLTMAMMPGRSFAAHVVAATPFLVAVLNVVLVAAITALVALQLGASTAWALVVGAAGFLAGMGAFAWYTNRLLNSMIRDYRPKFPGTDRTAPGS